MIITEFIRARSDVELVRLKNPVRPWHRLMGWPDSDLGPSGHGCLICQTFGCRSSSDYGHAVSRLDLSTVENHYMDLAVRNGDDATGAMIARLASRELARRDRAVLESIGDRAASTMSSEVERAGEMASV